MLSDAELWGITLPAPALPAESQGVWKAHLPAVRAFLAVQTQWRTASSSMGGIRFLGLDYTAADVALRRAGLDLDPRGWSELQIIEQAAAAALNED